MVLVTELLQAAG